jgi:hypothetical protein
MLKVLQTLAWRKSGKTASKEAKKEAAKDIYSSTTVEGGKPSLWSWFAINSGAICYTCYSYYKQAGAQAC